MEGGLLATDRSRLPWSFIFPFFLKILATKCATYHLTGFFYLWVQIMALWCYSCGFISVMMYHPGVWCFNFDLVCFIPIELGFYQ